MEDFVTWATFFMEPSDYYDAPIDKALHFISRCRINKGLIKRGKHNRSSEVAVQGLVLWPILIHTFVTSHDTDGATPTAGYSVYVCFHAEINRRYGLNVN
jgi:hypothetical protein